MASQGYVGDGAKMSQQEVFKKLMERRADAKVKREAKAAQVAGNALMRAYQSNGKRRI
jgi:cation transport regulator ChaB